MNQRLAVIPARGGSKRIPRKNIRELCGLPMIVHSIAAALQSDLFSRVVVSTDSEEIATVARTHGAEVPFLRESRLADDHTPSSEVTLDALQRLDPTANTFTHVAQLMPNCPLRTAQDIIASCRHFETVGTDAQISVTRYGWLNPWWAMTMAESGRLQPIFKDAITKRSQDLPPIYCPTGAIWWARCDALRREKTFHTPTRSGWEMPWASAVDIDDEADWQLAELVMRARMDGQTV